MVLVDLAFAAGTDYELVTKPFIEALGGRLAAWIDHHDHPAWIDYRTDERFVLVDKRAAPACPELVTPELTARIGPIDHILAHADFDGCIAAVKLLLGGRRPYPECDEDARAIDAPGHGYVCTQLGYRLNLAMDQQHAEAPAEYPRLLAAVAAALEAEAELPAELEARIRSLAQRQEARFAELEPMMALAKRPHPKVLALRLDRAISNSDKKTVLRRLEESALVAVIEEPKGLVVATYRDDLLDLSLLPGVKGGRGFVWGDVRLEQLLPHLARLIEDVYPPHPSLR